MLRTKRKNDAGSVAFRLSARPFTSGGQSEAQSRSKNRGKGLPDHIAVNNTAHLRFHQKRGGVGPIAHRHPNGRSRIREVVRLDASKRTGSGNAGDTCVQKLVAGSCFEGGGTALCLHFSIR